MYCSGAEGVVIMSRDQPRVYIIFFSLLPPLHTRSNRGLLSYTFEYLSIILYDTSYRLGPPSISTISSRQLTMEQHRFCGNSPGQNTINSITSLHLKSLLQTSWDGGAAVVQQYFTNSNSNPDFDNVDLALLVEAIGAVVYVRGHEKILKFLLASEYGNNVLRWPTGLNNKILRPAGIVS